MLTDKPSIVIAKRPKPVRETKPAQAMPVARIVLFTVRENAGRDQAMGAADRARINQWQVSQMEQTDQISLV